MTDSDDLEFWRLAKVVATTGLSKSELYRQMGDGLFPRSRPYPLTPSKKFWLSADVRRWQVAQVGDEFEALLG